MPTISVLEWLIFGGICCGGMAILLLMIVGVILLIRNTKG